MKYFYIIECADKELIDWYLLNELDGYKQVKAESLKSIKDNFYRKSILNINSKKYYLIDNIKDLEENFEIIASLVSGEFQNKNIIIYIVRDIDKRSKLYKKYKSLFISPNLDLASYTQTILNINEDKNLLSSLFDKCERNLNHYKNTLLKIIGLSKARDISFSESLKIIENVDFNTTKVDTFELVNMFLSRDIKNIKNILYLLQDSESFNFGFLTLLYNNFRNLFIIKSAGNCANSQNTGLSDFIIKNNLKYINNYSLEKLNNIVRLLQDIDKKIKFGVWDYEISTNMMITEILCEETITY